MIRNLLSISALAFTLFIASCGGSNDMASYDAINSGDVPLPVMSAFEMKHPDAMDVTWGKQVNGEIVEYKAAFMEDGKKKHAEYREREGVVMED